MFTSLTHFVEIFIAKFKETPIIMHGSDILRPDRYRIIPHVVTITFATYCGS